MRKLLTMSILMSFIAVPVVLADSGPDAAPIYKAKCAICHGANGDGQTPAGKAMKVKDLRSAEVKNMSDADLTKIISEGKGKMPAYKAKLTPAEISALVGYIKGLK